MNKDKRTSKEIASMAARYMKHPDKRVRIIAASTLANRRWGQAA